MNFTEWYPASVNPVRVGFYETYDPELKDYFFNFFDGFLWHSGSKRIGTIGSAIQTTFLPSWIKRWRGLTRPAS